MNKINSMIMYLLMIEFGHKPRAAEKSGIKEKH
jgi:hypothetical protein